MAAQAEESFIFSKLVEPLIEDLGLKSLSEAFDRAAEKKESGDKKQAAKKTTTKKKDEKTLTAEPKSITREGENSLVLHSNPSTFTIFNRMRHLLLQELLVKRYNDRLLKEGGDDSEEGEDIDEEERDKTEISKMVSLGIKGLFEIVKETWRKYPELCKKALQAFFDLLQGLDPEELNDEPAEVVDALNELLTAMVNEPIASDNQVNTEIASLATSCLISLVLSRGEPHRMLATINAVLTGPEELTKEVLQIPENFTAIQHVVQATLLNAVPFVDWFEDGVKSSSQIDQWSIKGVEGDGEGPRGVASDGKYLYVLSSQGLMKVGSGYGGTVKGVVYKLKPDFLTEESSCWIGFAAGKLYYYSGMPGEDEIVVINAESLEKEDTKQLDPDSLGPQTLLAFGDKLAQIVGRKDGAFVYREFDSSSSPLACTRERQLDYQQRSIVIHGTSEVLGDKEIKPSLVMPGVSSSSESSKLKDVKICSNGEHKFSESQVDHPCRNCTVCGHCTGYGPSCIATKGTWDRIPGNPCGCGSGCTGCLTCGICKVCATDGSIEGDHTLKEYYISKTSDQEVKATYSEGRQKVKKMKQTSTKKKGKDRLKVAVEEKSVDIGDDSTQVESIIVKNKQSVMLAKDGTVRYTGSQMPFGKDGETKEGEWETVTLPDDQTVSQMACTTTTAFFLSDKGSVYTSGLNQKGEMGMKPTGATKHTLMEHPKLKDQNIRSITAQGHKMAAINNEGSLFMFGKVSKKITDSDTGVVTSLLGTNTTQVALGQLHSAVITDTGKVLTFGQNRYGQCGRNYVPIPEKEEDDDDAEEDEEDEEDEDEPEQEPLPSPMDVCAGKHQYGKGSCRVCTVCGYCTGYGPGCCNTHTGDRLPGSDCGCGSGESGCSKCGACQICTGDPLPDKHSLMTYITSTDLDVVAVYEKGRERIKDLKEKEQGQKKEKKEKKKKKKAKASSESPPPPPPPPLPPILPLVNPSVPPPIPPHIPLVPQSLQSQSSIASESGLKLLFGCK